MLLPREAAEPRVGALAAPYSAGYDEVEARLCRVVMPYTSQHTRRERALRYCCYMLA